MPLLTSNQHPVDPYLLLVSVKNIAGVKDRVSKTHFLCVSIPWRRRDLIAYYQRLLLYHWKMGQTLALIYDRVGRLHISQNDFIIYHNAYASEPFREISFLLSSCSLR